MHYPTLYIFGSYLVQFVPKASSAVADNQKIGHRTPVNAKHVC